MNTIESTIFDAYQLARIKNAPYFTQLKALKEFVCENEDIEHDAELSVGATRQDANSEFEYCVGTSTSLGCEYTVISCGLSPLAMLEEIESGQTDADLFWDDAWDMCHQD